MTRMHKLYRLSVTTGKCDDCGLTEGHSNACHDAAPIRKIEDLYDELDKLNLQLGEARLALETIANACKILNEPGYMSIGSVANRGLSHLVQKPKCEHHVSRVFGTDGKQTVCSWCGADVTEKRKDEKPSGWCSGCGGLAHAGECETR